MKIVLHFFGRLLSNRLGQVLFIAHLFVVVWLFSQKSPVPYASVQHPRGTNSYSSSLIAGRIFHFHYESVPMKLLIVMDMPGLFLAFILSILLIPIAIVMPAQSVYVDSWLAGILCLVTTSFQWFLVGYLLRWLARNSTH